MEKEWLAFVFCWFGCIYDLLIGFFLFNRKTVNIAYVFVIIFHAATSFFFNIGMFPYIMMTITIIFFKESFHLTILNKLKALVRYLNSSSENASLLPSGKMIYLFLLFFFIQIALPFRYAFYDGDLFWTEQGYRFSWRVMLMEKAGTAFFFIEDSASGRTIEVDNKEYLTYMQEKMISTQPDMMVDYARFLRNEFEKKGMRNIKVKAQSYVTLNGSGSREFVDPKIDLSRQNNNIFSNKTWVRSYE